MSDKPSDDKERPRSSIFGSRSEEKKEEEKKPEDRPSPFGGRPTGSIFGKPTATSTFGRPTPMPPKPATSTGSTPKPSESKPASSIFGTRTAEAPKVEEAKPADPPKPASKPADAPKPEEKKPFFSGFGRKPADSPKPESPSAAPKPEEKKAGGFLSALRKPADAPKPAPPVDAPKIGTGKPAEKPRGGILGGAKPAEKPAEPAAKPEPAKPAEQKPPESSRKRVFWRLFKGSGAPSSEAGAPLKTPAPPDPKRGGSSVPGAPPARGEKQAKPLEGQTHVTVKNVGLSLDQKLDIVGWLLIGTGVVMIFGLIQPDEGTFTKAIVDIFGALFGYGRYLIPIPCLAVGGWLLVRYFKENPFLAFNALQMTGAALLFLSIVTWLHTIELIDKIVYDWDELIAVSARAVDLMQGGGWVGDRLYMILIRLTGEFGVPVVLTITTLVGALWFFELSLAEIAVYIKSVFQITGARLRRIRESWRAWRQAVATRRAARAAVRAELRAQRQAAKLAAQAQQQPQPTAGLPAAATLATAEMLSRQPISVPVDAEGQPPARKTAFRTPVVVPAVTVSESSAAAEDAAPPMPDIAKPSPLGARGAAAKKRSTAQPSPFSAPLGAAPAEQPSPAAEAPPEPKTTGVFSSPFGKPAQPEPTVPAATESATPEPPAEPPKRTTFGGIFGGKPKSEPSAAPQPETTAPAASTEPVTTAPSPEPPKRTTFGGIFGGKPKSEPSAAPQPETAAPAASTESETTASSPKPPAEPPKRTTFGGIFGSKPKSEPSAAPQAEATAPAASTESVTTAPSPESTAPSDPEITQPTRTTSIFSTLRPAPKPSDSKPAASPEDAETAEDDAPSAKAPPPKPSSSIFGSRASSPFSSPSAFRPAPKPSAASPAPDEAAPQADDELKYVPEPDAIEDDAEAERAPSAAAAPRIFGNFTPAKATESPAAPVPAAELPPMQLPPDETSWQMPDYRELLHAGSAQTITEEMLDERRRIIEETLEAFGAPGRVVEINVGPAITQFGVEPGYLSARGKQTRIKVNQIAKLDADLALALAARSIRIEAPVPGKGYVGIEVPNPETSLVGLRDIIASPAFNQVRSRLRLALGKSIDGAAVVADLTQMPHLLIAGTTGSGKSVCVNAIIACLLLQNAPDHLKLIMVDPKRVELTGYNGIPHLVSPVVVDLERVTGVLKWVSREMDDRYKKFAALGARNITDYNSKLGKAEPRLPYLVVIIDELADLMMLAPDETEKQLTRLAQMARATGIHLVISTQRPSVDVVTGLIKANFPARISFAVASSVDSRVILDQPGAEKLLGRGDMLYQAPDAAAPIRVQGVYVSDAELKQITDFWKNAQKERGTPLEAVSFDHAPDRPTAKLIKPGESAPFQSRTERFGSSPFGTPRFAPPRPKPSEEEEKFFAALRDEPPKETKVDEALYERAVELYKQLGAALNVSALQRRLNVDYTQAQSLYKLMRERGVLNADNGEHGADA